MFVADRMTANPHKAFEEDPVSNVEQLLRQHRIHQLPVVDHAGRLTGIITDRDVRSAVGYDAVLGDGLSVSEVMTASPTTVSLDAALDDALRILCTNRFNALPVMNNHDLVGIITRQDVLSAFHDILGLNRKSHRVEIALPNLRDDLRDAFKALHSLDGEVISVVVSSMRKDGDEPTLYLRIAGSKGRLAERALRNAGLIVLEPEYS